MQVVAAKAVTFKIAEDDGFEHQRRTLGPHPPTGCWARRQTAGVSVVTGGTDVHLVLVDLRDSPLDGKAAEDLLHGIGITVNRNAVPNDPRPPMVTSGLRIGTSALATRGFGDTEFTEVADIIAPALAQPAEMSRRASFPLYEGLEDWELHGGPERRPTRFPKNV